jgi:hypothetical protein
MSKKHWIIGVLIYMLLVYAFPMVLIIFSGLIIDLSASFMSAPWIIKLSIYILIAINLQHWKPIIFTEDKDKDESESEDEFEKQEREIKGLAENISEEIKKTKPEEDDKGNEEKDPLAFQL